MTWSRDVVRALPLVCEEPRGGRGPGSSGNVSNVNVNTRAEPGRARQSLADCCLSPRSPLLSSPSLARASVAQLPILCEPSRAEPSRAGGNDDLTDDGVNADRQLGAQHKGILPAATKETCTPVIERDRRSSAGAKITLHVTQRKMRVWVPISDESFTSNFPYWILRSQAMHLSKNKQADKRPFLFFEHLTKFLIFFRKLAAPKGQ